MANDSVKSSSNAMLVLNLAAKALLVGLLAYALTNLEMDQFRGKAMEARAAFYPLFALLIPIGWWLRGRPRPYPHDADLLLVSPFLIDVAGNVANLYNSVVWFDDAAHTVTWMLLVLAVGSLILRLRLEHWITACLCIGFGAVSHILWEIIEFVALTIGAPGLHLTYEDTIGDLAMSLGGSFLAGFITGRRAERRDRTG